MSWAVKSRPGVVSQIHRLRNQGLIHKEIASALGISHTSVGRCLNPLREERDRVRRELKRADLVHTTVNGQHIRIEVPERRARPDRCELCDKNPKNPLNWHHWNDKHLEWGLWLCWRCHWFAERVERGLVEKYLELKKWATEETRSGYSERERIGKKLALLYDYKL